MHARGGTVVEEVERGGHHPARPAGALATRVAVVGARRDGRCRCVRMLIALAVRARSISHDDADVMRAHTQLATWPDRSPNRVTHCWDGRRPVRERCRLLSLCNRRRTRYNQPIRVDEVRRQSVMTWFGVAVVVEAETLQRVGTTRRRRRPLRLDRDDRVRLAGCIDDRNGSGGPTRATGSVDAQASYAPVPRTGRSWFDPAPSRPAGSEIDPSGHRPGR